MSIRVTIVDGSSEEFAAPIIKAFEKEEITVGRGDGNDVVLAADFVSEHHLKIVAADGYGEPCFFIIDSGSANGTFIENSRVPPGVELLVKCSQRIIVGSFRMKVTVMAEKARLGRVEETKAAHVALQPVANCNDIPQVEESPKPSASPAGSEKTIPCHLAVETGNAQTVSLHISAIPLSSLRGVVRAGHAAVAGALIDAGEFGTTVTAADGSYVLSGLPDGAQFTLHVLQENSVYRPKGFSGTVQGDTHFDIQLNQAASIRGAIAHNGVAIAGVKVECAELGSTISDAEGRFHFTNAIQGCKYTITLSHPGYSFAPATLEAAPTSDPEAPAPNPAAEAPVTERLSFIHRLLHAAS